MNTVQTGLYTGLPDALLQRNKPLFLPAFEQSRDTVHFSGSLGTKKPKSITKLAKYQQANPSPFLQSILGFYNRMVQLKNIHIDVSLDDLEKLRTLHPDAGSIIVGAHPEMTDGQLMAELVRQGKPMYSHAPYLVMITSEQFVNYPLYFMHKAGAVPIIKGTDNKVAIDSLTENLAKGSWVGIMPEGHVYWSRKVMDMEVGTLKIAFSAVEENIKAGTDRPIYLNRIAHTYKFTRPRESQVLMKLSLEELEKDICGRKLPGSIPERIEKVGHALLDKKAAAYNLSTKDWSGLSIFDKARSYQEQLLEVLGKKYEIQVNKNRPLQRQIQKIRMEMHTQLNELQEKQNLTDDNQAKIKDVEADIRNGHDIALLMPFTEDYYNTHQDLEAQSETLRRWQYMAGHNVMGNYGQTTAHVRVLDPIDLRPYAKEWIEMKSTTARMRYLQKMTETLIRKPIEEAVKTLIDSRSEHFKEK